MNKFQKNVEFEIKRWEKFNDAEKIESTSRRTPIYVYSNEKGNFSFTKRDVKKTIKALLTILSERVNAVNPKPYWTKVISKDHSFVELIRSKEFENGEMFITRPEWDGVHFSYKEGYFILLKDGRLLFNPKEVYDTDKKDWMVVKVSNKTKKLLYSAIHKKY